MVFVSLPPDCFRLRFNASHSVKDDYSAVQNLKRAFHFHSEVHMSRRVNNIKSVLFARIAFFISWHPKTSDSGGGDGDASLFFLLHPVSGRLTLVHFSYLVGRNCVIQNTLGSRRLSGINMGNNPKISNFFQWIVSVHVSI